ncbi:MAG: hypothetical protein CFE45_05805 [Burkholderiales bacterium PBB5]|nr:MAG: hypothetical protein CFE45_05805 [Burkholderiales bacterium PBB5]
MLILLALSACQEPPCECGCPPEVTQRIELRLAQMSKVQPKMSVAPGAAKRVIVCSADKPEGCTIDVPVTVVKDDQGKVTACQVALPYCVVCMRKGKAGSPAPVVTWQLTEDGKLTTGFVFADNLGIDIKHAGATGKDDFRKLGVVEPGNQFKWQAGPGRSDALGHEAQVYTVDGTVACSRYDPVIVNTD